MQSPIIEQINVLKLTANKLNTYLIGGGGNDWAADKNRHPLVSTTTHMLTLFMLMITSLRGRYLCISQEGLVVL